MIVSIESRDCRPVDINIIIEISLLGYSNIDIYLYIPETNFAKLFDIM